MLWGVLWKWLYMTLLHERNMDPELSCIHSLHWGDAPLGSYCHIFAPTVARCGVQVYSTFTIWSCSEPGGSLSVAFKFPSNVVEIIQIYPFPQREVLTLICCLRVCSSFPSLSTCNSIALPSQLKKLSKMLVAFLVCSEIFSMLLDSRSPLRVSNNFAPLILGPEVGALGRHLHLVLLFRLTFFQRQVKLLSPFKIDLIFRKHPIFFPSLPMSNS